MTRATIITSMSPSSTPRSSGRPTMLRVLPTLAALAQLSLISENPALAAQSPGSKTGFFGRIDHGHVVELVDPVAGTAKAIYSSSRWMAKDLSISPTGGYLGMLEMDSGVVQGVSYRIPPRAELIVLDTTGAVLHRVASSVQRYAWCGPSCLVYVLGTDDETDMGFHPTGAEVSDFSSGVRKALPGPPWPYGVFFAPFDGSVYLKYPD